MNYLYIVGTIFFTVYGQLILKWRIAIYGQMPQGVIEKGLFLGRLFFDPFILSGLFAAFVASLFWMAAMTKFPISHAYPFMSLAFVLVLIFGGIFFHEPINLPKIAGVSLIVLGIVVSSQG